MGLQCGIVGLPNVGKSTLFNALSSAKAQAANFPFCTIEPNVGVITVPDDRLIRLAELVKPEKIIPTTMEIVDIAGLVKGASKGEGLGNQFLGNIRETNAIIHVLRCFEDENVVHVDGSVNPVRDKEVVDTELQLKDLETIEKKMQNLERIVRSNDKDAIAAMELVKQLKAHIEKGQSVRTFPKKFDENKSLADLYLLTSKPIVYVCNVDEQSVVSGNKFVDQIREAIKNENAELIIISAAIEADIAQLDSYDDRKAFLVDLGLKESGLARLVHSAYHLLNLITFLTAGPKEVRAWTIYKGMTAPQSAGVIHTDFEKGFIRVEVITYDDYIQYGSEAACRDIGKLRVEGKEYIVHDGDVMHFRFNV